jgi:hypothetical protein
MFVEVKQPSIKVRMDCDTYYFTAKLPATRMDASHHSPIPAFVTIADMTGSITEQGLLTFLLARVIILARPTPWKGNYDALDHERKVV